MTILTLSRRSILRGVPVLAGAAVLGACTVTTSGSTTTITLNVAKIEAYAQAGLNAAATVTSLLGAVPAAASYVALIATAETALSAALTTLSTAAGSTVTISYDDTDWKTRVDSVLSAIETVGTAIANAITAAGSGLSSTVQTDATTALSALKTVISVFDALLVTSTGARPVGVTSMSEAQALRTLGVSR